jgi:hypothetical protein
MATVHDDGEGNVADGDGHRTLETMGFQMTAKKCQTTVARLARNVPAVIRILCSTVRSARSRYETLTRASSLVGSVFKCVQSGLFGSSPIHIPKIVQQRHMVQVPSITEPTSCVRRVLNDTGTPASGLLL